MRTIPFSRLVALVAMLTLLLTALPSTATAKPGGNAAASAACEDGGHLRYQDADGKVFKSAGQCTRYAAQGGTLTGLWIEFSVRSNGFGYVTVQGVGLKPNSLVLGDYSYLTEDPRNRIEFGFADADGAFSHSAHHSCNYMAGLMAYGMAKDGWTVRATGTPVC